MPHPRSDLKECNHSAEKPSRSIDTESVFENGARCNDKKWTTRDIVAVFCSPWYTDAKGKPGPTLFELLDSTEIPARDALAPFRMAVIDKFKDLGTVVMGKSEAGCVRKGDTLLVMPNKCAPRAASPAPPPPPPPPPTPASPELFSQSCLSGRTHACARGIAPLAEWSSG